MPPREPWLKLIDPWSNDDFFANTDLCPNNGLLCSNDRALLNIADETIEEDWLFEKPYPCTRISSSYGVELYIVRIAGGPRFISKIEILASNIWEELSWTKVSVDGI